MVDNITVSQGSGTTIATDDVGGVQYQRIKVSLGADGSATDALGGAGVVSAGVQRFTLASDDVLVAKLPVSLGVSGGLKIDGSGTALPISGTVAATQSGTWNIGAITTLPALPTGTNVIGSVATVTSLSQFAGAAINLGAGAVSTGTLRITQASDSPEIAALGGPSDTAWATGSGSQIALLKTLATAALSSAASPVNIQPATTGGLTSARVVTGTTGFIKASAGQMFTVTAYNANAAVRYLHLYNKASAPTLSTDTPIITIPLLGASVQHVNFTEIGRVFSVGIAWAYTTDDVAIPVTAGTSAELHFSAGYA